jgi:hypothetical protein
MSYNRRTLATSFSLDLNTIYETGGFKNVYRGRFEDGPRSNQSCVGKEYQIGPVYNINGYASELEVINKTIDIVTRFNGQSERMDIYVNEPDIYTHPSRQMFLVEPFIRSFEKYNSNTGWTKDEDSFIDDYMQSLSHFSYHSTGGNLLLCDIQGGSFNKGFALTDPVVMSHFPNRFGETDLGRDGINAFFAYHDCNDYCDQDWKKPKYQRPAFSKTRGTTICRGPSAQTSRYQAPAAVYSSDSDSSY